MTYAIPVQCSQLLTEPTNQLRAVSKTFFFISFILKGIILHWKKKFCTAYFKRQGQMVSIVIVNFLMQ